MGMGGEDACREYYGDSVAAAAGASDCTSPKVWHAGVGCKATVPTVDMFGACQIAGISDPCIISWKVADPSFCFTCATACGSAICTTLPAE
jgi:hypothetical protein